MKSLLKNIFGLFAALVFALSLIVVIICYFLIFTFFNATIAPRIAHQYISRKWAKFLFPAFGIKVKVIGKELLNIERTYVFIGNHRSLLDVPAYAIATDHSFRFLAKEELTKIPFMGYIIRKLYISVNRKDKYARAKSMERMQQSIRDGISVFICPEGTRNTSDQPLLEFRDGAFRLAIQAQVPLAVMAITGSDKLLSPKKSFALSPGKMICRWAVPIETAGMTSEDVPRLKEKARMVMEELLR